MEEKATEAYRTSVQELDNFKGDGQLHLKKEKNPLEKAEDFEKFIEEQIDL